MIKCSQQTLYLTLLLIADIESKNLLSCIHDSMPFMLNFCLFNRRKLSNDPDQIRGG